MRQCAVFAWLLLSVASGCGNEDLGSDPGGDPSSSSPDPGGPSGGALEGHFVNNNETAVLLFTPEGDFALGSSSEVDNAWWNLEIATADWRGKWRLQGQEIFLTFEDRSHPNLRGRVGAGETIQITESGGKVTEYGRSKKLARNLVGRYHYTTSKNVVNGDHFVTFTGNRVTIFDSVGVFAGGTYVFTETTVSGEFVVDGYSMKLFEDTGAVSRHSLYVSEWVGSDPKLISFDDKTYTH